MTSIELLEVREVLETLREGLTYGGSSNWISSSVLKYLLERGKITSYEVFSHDLGAEYTIEIPGVSEKIKVHV